VADGTLRKELGVLKAALNWALKEDWIPKAPMFDLPPSGEARKRWLTKDEARLLLDAAESLHVRTFIALALFTAGRMSAILDLTWDRVDEQAGVLDLSDGKAHGKKRRQRLPIASFLKPYLAEARAAATTRWVVEYRGGRVRDIGRGVAAAASAAGLEGVTPHVFRHTAATWAIQSGTPVKAVADLLGDTAEMVERHYGHHDPAWMRDVIKGLAL
jgi:integrase